MLSSRIKVDRHRAYRRHSLDFGGTERFVPYSDRSWWAGGNEIGRSLKNGIHFGCGSAHIHPPRSNVLEAGGRGVLFYQAKLLHRHQRNKPDAADAIWDSYLVYFRRVSMA